MAPGGDHAGAHTSQHGGTPGCTYARQKLRLVARRPLPRSYPPPPRASVCAAARRALRGVGAVRRASYT
eukprot:1396470-Pleurochrysis_carterae.AAC.3